MSHRFDMTLQSAIACNAYFTTVLRNADNERLRNVLDKSQPQTVDGQLWQNILFELRTSAWRDALATRAFLQLDELCRYATSHALRLAASSCKEDRRAAF
nr:hypothetical protein CFP56_07777 [Quercus suber]